LGVNEALREIDAIENLLGPYEFFSHDAKKFLNVLRELKKVLGEMDKDRIRQIAKEMENIEEAAAPYRGYGFVEEALKHAKKLLSELKNILEE